MDSPKESCFNSMVLPANLQRQINLKVSCYQTAHMGCICAARKINQTKPGKSNPRFHTLYALGSGPESHSNSPIPRAIYFLRLSWLSTMNQGLHLLCVRTQCARCLVNCNRSVGLEPYGRTRKEVYWLCSRQSFPQRQVLYIHSSHDTL